MKLLSLFFGLIHSSSAIVLLLFSGWFIASCAIYGFDFSKYNFNYLLPAVLIRGLALLRISSGYAQMWTGHRDLLDTLKKVRLDLFERLKNTRTHQRARGTEALAKHSEVIAGVNIAWTVHNLSFVLLVFITTFAIWVWLSEWLVVWLIFLCSVFALLIYSFFILKNNNLEVLKLSTEFRHLSEHHLLSAPLWHLRQNLKHPDIQQLYAKKEHLSTISEHMLWWCQFLAFVVLLFVLWKAPQEQNAMLMIILLLLLTAKDWLSPVFYSTVEYSQYKQSTQAFEQLVLEQVEPIENQPEAIQELTLCDFSVINRPVNSVNFTIRAGEVVLLEGESGTGKTSILKAIAGLLQHSGEKCVNKKKVHQGFIHNWHYAEQNPQVLSGSLRTNLRLANANANDELLLEALSFSNLGHLNNLDEWIGTNGRQLSGGELKRLALARSYLFDATLYLFDEPFEGLNAELQQSMAEAINRLSCRAPVILASHIQPKNLTIHQTLTTL